MQGKIIGPQVGFIWKTCKGKNEQGWGCGS